MPYFLDNLGIIHRQTSTGSWEYLKVSEASSSAWRKDPDEGTTVRNLEPVSLDSLIEEGLDRWNADVYSAVMAFLI